jgi:hypothetical protein
LVLFSVPFSVASVFYIVRKKFIKSKLKSVAYVVEEICLTIVIFCAIVLVFKRDNNSLQLRDYKIYSRTIAIAVVIAVLFEVVSTVILVIMDLREWCRSRGKKKAE